LLLEHAIQAPSPLCRTGSDPNADIAPTVNAMKTAASRARPLPSRLLSCPSNHR